VMLVDDCSSGALTSRFAGIPSGGLR
jgi:hypothetical protein